jgi:hypothetical protein
MKRRLVLWLLRLLGEPTPLHERFSFYALVTPGERIADVTTNFNRARALTLEATAKGQTVDVWQCYPVRKIKLR